MAAKPVIVIRGNDEYAAWVEELMRACNCETKARLVDIALRDLALTWGVRRPPARVNPVGENQHTLRDNLE